MGQSCILIFLFKVTLQIEIWLKMNFREREDAAYYCFFGKDSCFQKIALLKKWLIWKSALFWGSSFVEKVAFLKNLMLPKGN